MKAEYNPIKIQDFFVKNIGSVAAIVPFQSISEQISISKTPYQPQLGDLAIFKVADSNKKIYITVQNYYGRIVNLYPGDIIVGVFGPRESTTHVMGEIPQKIMSPGDITNILSEGGIVGDVTYIPNFMGESVKIKIIGFLKYKNIVMNLKHFSPKIENKLTLHLPPVILVVGTSSEIGKTTVATRIINILVNKYDKKVSSVMMTGTGSKADALNHLSSGAYEMHSLIETGVPCTYDPVTDNNYLDLIENLFHRIANDEKPDIIVGEMGGDYVWGKNDVILQKSKIMNFTKHIVVAASDVISAIGTKYLFEEWEIKSPYTFVNSWLRGYAGMKLRYKKILNLDLVDVSNIESIEQMVDNIYNNI